ncbi:MAG: NifU family protein [Candidatus Omnitrophica bacterium]|nr:NifU family protein [Candidatus Omnitrophota bacterium]
MTLREKVEEALKEVNCFLQMEGGNCEIVDVTDDGIVKLKLQGSCEGCPFSEITLKMQVEKIIKERVPEVKEVINVETVEEKV